jgi:hypothetical protein
MITKDFHFTKDFPLIRGKSFVIMECALAPPGHRGRNGRSAAGQAALVTPERALRLKRPL